MFIAEGSLPENCMGRTTKEYRLRQPQAPQRILDSLSLRPAEAML